MEERVALFIDGSNLYHGFIDSAKGLNFRPADYQNLDFMALARNLAKGRQVTEVRYYVGRVRQEGDRSNYTHQRKLLNALERDGVTCRLGRLEKRERPDESARSLAKWLAALPKRAFNLEPSLCRELEDLSRQTLSRRLGVWLSNLSARGIRLHPDAYQELHRLRREGNGMVLVEKAVDVMIATDMLSMAYRDDYDVAYLLSADGDFTPVVEEIRKTGRKVFAASPLPCATLANHANAFIRLKRDFFTDLWRKTTPSRSPAAARKARQRR